MDADPETNPQHTAQPSAQPTETNNLGDDMAAMAPEVAAFIGQWKSRITLVHQKRGRSLMTSILHVEGEEEPPAAILMLAASNWEAGYGGQFVRRPDEEGKKVYWVNIANPM